MGRFYVIQTGRTTWETESRIDSAAGAPLTDAGARAVRQVSRELAEKGVSVVYSGTGEAERQCARMIAHELKAKPRTDGNLTELDYGLWQGLTIGEVRQRQPKLYRNWVESPASVRPPGGESLAEGCERLRRALKGILKRHKGAGEPVVVLRPVMLGLLRCVVAGEPLEQIWDQVDPEFTWAGYELNGKQL